MLIAVERSFAQLKIGRSADEASSAALKVFGHGRDGHVREVDLELSCPLIILFLGTVGGPF